MAAATANPKQPSNKRTGRVSKLPIRKPSERCRGTRREGDPTTFVTRPISPLILGLGALSLLGPYLLGLWARLRADRRPVERFSVGDTAD